MHLCVLLQILHIVWSVCLSLSVLITLCTVQKLLQKYITYRNAAGGGPSHGHRQHPQKIGKDRACGSEDILVDKHTQMYSSSYFATALAGEVIIMKLQNSLKEALTKTNISDKTDSSCLLQNRDIFKTNKLRG